MNSFLERPRNPSVLMGVVGPTGTGKTAFAVELAERVQGEIVSVDSAQIFRGLNIGTAKVSKEEQSRVRHHLIDVAEPHEQWSAARFQVEADAAVSDIRQRGKLPILCGGTGLWLRALTHGIFYVPEIDPAIRKQVRERLETEGSLAMHQELARCDPEAAHRIQPQDPQRIGRALEVFFQTGRTISSFQKEHGFQRIRHHLVAVAFQFPADELRFRLNLRSAQMFEEGLLEEVDFCLQNGIARDAPGLICLGYREAVRYRFHEQSLEEAIVRTQATTRQYAKRQKNWFIKLPEVHWEPPTKPDEQIQDALLLRYEQTSAQHLFD